MKNTLQKWSGKGTEAEPFRIKNLDYYVDITGQEPAEIEDADVVVVQSPDSSSDDPTAKSKIPPEVNANDLKEVIKWAKKKKKGT